MAHPPPLTSPPDRPGSRPAGEVAWELLLSLSAGERHGYAILLDVQERTGGRLRLLPGSLYRALHRLLADGWVEVVPEAPAAREDSRRTVYRLTSLGARSRRVRRRASPARCARLDNAVFWSRRTADDFADLQSHAPPPAARVRARPRCGDGRARCRSATRGLESIVDPPRGARGATRARFAVDRHFVRRSPTRLPSPPRRWPLWQASRIAPASVLRGD